MIFGSMSGLLSAKYCFVNETMKKPLPDYAVPALDKGLDILEALSTCPEPQTLSALATLVGRKNNEIFRMLNLLERRHYVLRDESGGYRLSLRLYQLAHAQPSVTQLMDASMPILRELSASTGESCHLSLLEGLEIVVIAQVESSQPVRIAVEVGGRFSALTTVSGRMLLAGLDPEVRNTLLETSPAYQKLSAASRKELLRSIALVAKQGFSTAHNETVEGVTDVAAGLGKPGTGIHAAVAISALTKSRHTGEPREFIHAVRLCADKISTRLGISQSG